MQGIFSYDTLFYLNIVEEVIMKTAYYTHN